MPLLETKNFGRISYDAESTVVFPDGLPGFEDRRGFVLLAFPASDPLVFLQSLEDRDLCFITLPVLAVKPGYPLAIKPEDLQKLDLPVARQPRIGEEVLCLAVVSLHESGPTANLLAPLVLNLRNRFAVQAVRPDAEYSHQHVLVAEGAEAAEPAEEVVSC